MKPFMLHTEAPGPGQGGLQRPSEDVAKPGLDSLSLLGPLPSLPRPGPRGPAPAEQMHASICGGGARPCYSPANYIEINSSPAPGI